jgi:hypothetical protein
LQAYAKLEYDQLTEKMNPQSEACIKHRYRLTLLEMEAVEEEVVTFEDDHGIKKWWTVESKEYKDAQEHLSVQAYQDALTTLETLVTQCLLELTKLQMSGLCKYLFY